MSTDPRDQDQELEVRPQTLQLKWMVPLVAFGLWTLWPVLTSAHLEAFSAQLQSIAILMNRHGPHGLSLADQSYPITTEFLYMSRSGLVDLLQIAMRVTGSTGDWVFRLLMILSFCAFSWASIQVARRWSEESVPLLFLVFLLTPGLVEIGYFFSDNLPSAAFAMLALAGVPKESESDSRWLAVGALMAFALLVRFDAVVMSVPLCVCLYIGKPHWKRCALRAGLMIAGTIFIMGLAHFATPYRLTESLKITKLFSTLHEWLEADSRLKVVSLGFFGYITPWLIGIGAISFIRRNNVWRAIWLVGLPIAFYAMFLPKAIEIRMFLLLGTPALLIHGAAGIRWMHRQWLDKGSSLLPKVVRPLSASILIFTMLGPVDIVIRDGPRTAIGRLWTPILWHEWQQNVDNGMAQLDSVVRQATPGNPLLAISSHYNADDDFRLRVLQAGFDMMEPDRAKVQYAGASEVFQMADQTIAHLRCPDPYLLLGQWYKQPYFYSEALQIIWGLSALKPENFKTIYSLNWQFVPGFFGPITELPATSDKQWHVQLPATPFIPKRAQVPEGSINVQRLTSEKVSTLLASAQHEAAAAQKHAKTWVPIRTESEFHQKFDWRFGPSP